MNTEEKKIQFKKNEKDIEKLKKYDQYKTIERTNLDIVDSIENIERPIKKIQILLTLFF